jgi:uncharacterized protein
MTILITGATGLVGKKIVQLLRKNNYTIHYLTTNKHKIANQLYYKGYYWNPSQGYLDTNAFKNVTAIIHLAGENVGKRWTTEYKNKIITSRTQGTQLLYDFLEKNTHQIKHFISASAIGIYPDSLSEIYTEEDTNTSDTFLGQVVKQWENKVQKINTLGINTAILRTGVVLDKNEGALSKMLFPTKIGFGSALGSGKQYMSWIHVEDLAAMYFFVLKNNLVGVFNAVTPHPITNHNFSKALAKSVKRPFFMPAIPAFVLKILFGEMYLLLTESQNVSCKKIISKGFQFQFASLTKAFENILK